MWYALSNLNVKLEIVIVKHCAPNHMVVHKDSVLLSALKNTFSKTRKTFFKLGLNFYGSLV